MVSDGTDNVLVAITGETGDGIAVVDLTSLPEPLPLPYASVATSNLKSLSQGSFAKTMKSPQDQAAKVGAATSSRHPRRIPHRTNPLTLPARLP